MRALLPKRHRKYALSLLRRIVSYERWGIPPATPAGWVPYFKGGWFQDDDGWRVHQGALLRTGTAGSPSPSSPAAVPLSNTEPRRSPG
jgi:hypothetical protein